MKANRKAVGEADQPNHTRVLLPVPRKSFRDKASTELVWVKVTSGTKDKGSGIIDHEPVSPGFKLGQVISFEHTAGETFAKFKAKRHIKNQLVKLKNDLAESIREAMTFRPATNFTHTKA